MIVLLLLHFNAHVLGAYNCCNGDIRFAIVALCSLHVMEGAMCLTVGITVVTSVG